MEAHKLALDQRRASDDDDTSSGRLRDLQTILDVKRRRSGKREPELEQRELSKAKVERSMLILAMKRPRPE